MATANPTDRAPLHQPTPIRRPHPGGWRRRRCGTCHDTLARFRGCHYCPSCTFFVPCGDRPTVQVTVNVAFEGAEELLQRLHDCGWDVTVGGGEARLYRPDVRTAAEAQLTLQRGGFDASLFAVTQD